MIKNLLLCIALFLVFSSKAQTGLSNLSFENWGTSIIGPQPNGWFGITVSQQTVGAQQGTSYVRVVTTQTGTSSDGLLFLGQLSSSFNLILGEPYTLRPNSLNGFYKTSGLAVGDSITIEGILKNGPTLIGAGIMYDTNNVAGWTSFSIPLSYFSASNPDTILINAASNMETFGGGPNAIGSILDLDNLSLAFPTGVDQKSIGTSFLVFPNPASSELNIISKDKNAASVIILDVNGRVVDEIFLENEKTRIDLEKYSSGVYSYSIESKSKAKLLSNKFIITK